MAQSIAVSALAGVRKEGRRDGRKDGRKEGWMDERKDG
jgi:hypothetical protein